MESTTGNIVAAWPSGDGRFQIEVDRPSYEKIAEAIRAKAPVSRFGDAVLRVGDVLLVEVEGVSEAPSHVQFSPSDDPNEYVKAELGEAPRTTRP